MAIAHCQMFVCLPSDVTVLFAQDMVVVQEGSGLPATVCVVLSDALAPTEAEIVIFVSTMDDTALGIHTSHVSRKLALSVMVSWTMPTFLYHGGQPHPIPHSAQLDPACHGHAAPPPPPPCMIWPAPPHPTLHDMASPTPPYPA